MKFKHNIAHSLFKRSFNTILLTTTLISSSIQASDYLEEGFILTSIKPLQLIAADITQGVIETKYILPAGASPHAYSLRPSEVKNIQAAQLIYWVGPNLETFLQKPFQQHHSKETALLPALASLTQSDSHAEHHDHADHESHEEHASDTAHHDHESHESHESHYEHQEHADHESHAAHESHEEHASDTAHHDHESHESHDEHQEHTDHESHAAHESHEEHASDTAHHDHESHESHDEHQGHVHDHGGTDPHIWLDPKNAMTIATIIKQQLVQLYPQHSALLEKNYQNFTHSLNKTDLQISQALTPLKSQGFIVFHDAYSHFIKHYQLNQVAALTINPSKRPGAKHLAKIRDLLNATKPVCIFSEPQFNKVAVTSVVRGFSIKVGELDPLAVSIKADNNRYAVFLDDFAQNFVNCLADK